MLPPRSNNGDLEEALDRLPDEVAGALEKWRIATLEREKVEALLYGATKGQDKGMTATEIRAAVHASPSRYEAVLAEIKAEAEYTRIYERLLSAKKKASLRTAY